MRTEAQRKYHREWVKRKYQTPEGKAAILEMNRRWTQRNHEKRLAYWTKRNHRPEIKEKRVPTVPIAQLSPEDAEHRRQIRRKYYQKNSEKLRAYWKAYRKKHADKTKAHNKANWHKRRALLAGAAINLEKIKEFIFNTRSKKTFTCYYCEERFPIERLHFDHVVPLCKGGAHSVDNLCTSCDSCNQEKHDKQITAWIKVGQQILSL